MAKYDLDDVHYVATLVNPSDHKPYIIGWNATVKDIHVIEAAEVDAAKGTYFAVGSGDYHATSSYDEKYGASERATGCPRVHTARGVTDKRAGLGLMLYSGLVLGVAFAKGLTPKALRDLGLSKVIDVLSEDPCVSSSGGSGQRSPEAARWWERQKSAEYRRKYPETSGLVEEVDDGGGGEEECDDFEVEYGGDDDLPDRRWARDELEARDSEAELKDFNWEDTPTAGTIKIEYCKPGGGDGESTYDVIRAEKVAAAPFALDLAEATLKGLDLDADDNRNYGSPAFTKSLMLEMDLSGIIDPAFLKMLEEVFVSLDGTGAEFQRFIRSVVPFYSPDTSKAKAAGLPRKNGRGRARRNTPTQHSQAWVAAFGGFIE